MFALIQKMIGEFPVHIEQEQNVQRSEVINRGDRQTLREKVKVREKISKRLTLVELGGGGGGKLSHATQKFIFDQFVAKSMI